MAAFVAVASCAGLQWFSWTAQTEAARQQTSRQSLAELSSLLQRFETAPKAERPVVAEHLTGVAERLSKGASGEKLASASRRVVALASYETGGEAREKELQERLRAEVRGLVSEAESAESAALGRAASLAAVNQMLLLGAAALCGLLAFRSRRSAATA